MWTYLKEFKHNYQPYHYLAILKAKTEFKGSLSLKQQYMPGKPTKQVIKA
jgi:hypothetical protein